MKNMKFDAIITTNDITLSPYALPRTISQATILITVPIIDPINPNPILNKFSKRFSKSNFFVNKPTRLITYVKLNMPEIGNIHIIKTLATH